MMTDKDDARLSAGRSPADDRLPEGYTLVEALDGSVVLNPAGKQMTVAAAWAEAFPDEVPAGAVVTVEPTAPMQWMDSDPAALIEALDRRQLNRSALMDWLEGSLVAGIDYGRIHVVKKANCDKGARCTIEAHFSKPTLWKAGAEKITGMLGLRPHWPDLVDELKSIKDGCGILTLRCQLLDPVDHVAGEGVGARNVEQDWGDVNKALKMCKKSSLVDAVLSTAGLSEVFTQDLGAGGDGAEDPDETPDALNDDGQRFLKELTIRLFCDDVHLKYVDDEDQAKDERAETILQSLACRRFRLDDGDWRKIPAYRLQDAIRSLEEKRAGLDADEGGDA